MGYWQTGEGFFTIDRGDLDKAYEVLCKLNERDDLKNGGSWPGGDKPRPAGMDHHPDKWFSWMSADYPAKCDSLQEILTELGFNIFADDEDGLIHFSVTYDSKMGQESLFFRAMESFIKEMHITWRGEDGGLWLWTVDGKGHFIVLNGSVTYS